jgi:hypothetical protein
MGACFGDFRVALGLAGPACSQRRSDLTMIGMLNVAADDWPAKWRWTSAIRRQPGKRLKVTG